MFIFRYSQILLVSLGLLGWKAAVQRRSLGCWWREGQLTVSQPRALTAKAASGTPGCVRGGEGLGHLSWEERLRELR